MFTFLKLSNITRQISTSCPNYFRLTPALLGEPLKKKKKIDPMVIKQREERRRRRLEKQIKKLEKNTRQYKPIDECEVPEELSNERKLRKRVLEPLSEETLVERVKLFKEWARYKHRRQLVDLKMFERLLMSQQLALDELRNESEELYQAAIQIDQTLIPFRSRGPVETPPIENFDSPDGEYIDISKKWKV
ncbi:large ribosomal subunit protein mL40 [Halyomorpha halys]|uniref:large ribosomal subunit protein mL40 n=1 Tax=Halyomorpha halys TaxID=286706 RepID=UPI0006D4FA25|nr:39S ribosomal protein L40, mitochondrial [Halyomorpha halys]